MQEKLMGMVTRLMEAMKEMRFRVMGRTQSPRLRRWMSIAMRMRMRSMSGVPVNALVFLC